MNMSRKFCHRFRLGHRERNGRSRIIGGGKYWRWLKPVRIEKKAGKRVYYQNYSNYSNNRQGKFVFHGVQSPFRTDHNGNCPMQNPRFIDDSLLYMVSFVRQKPAEGWSTVLK